MSLVRYRPNPYRRMYSRTSSNARARGQFAAAKKSNDRLEFVVNCNHVFTASYNPADESGVAAINVWDVLERNGYFGNLSNMYDQIKIDGITVKLSVTNAYTEVSNLAAIKNITTYVGWDRTGLSTNQVKLYDSSGNEIPEMNDDEAEVKTWRTNIGSAIVKATGVVKNEINSFQRWRYSTYLYPSLLQEKQQYITTSDIKRFNKSFDVNTTKFTVADRYNNQSPNGLYDSSNPVVPFESSNVKFKPTLLVGVFQNGLSENNGQYGEITQYGKCNPVIFNAEFSISCSFKNLKGVSIKEEYKESESLNLQSKYVKITNDNVTQTIKPDSGYNGLSEVMIESDIPTIQNIQSLNIRNNGIYNLTPTFPNEYITKAEINVDVPTEVTELQNKTININQNGTEIISADMGYDALGSVTINTNIPSSSINTQQKTVNIEENGTIAVNPDPGYALSKVNVNTNVFTWDEIINELPLEIDLRTDHSKKAVFYVPGVSDYNTSTVPFTLTYQNKQGQTQQKVVASMKPFRIINFYEDDIFRENGNYYISFNNYNESIVASKYKGDKGHILLHNREAPINNFGFRINVPKNEITFKTNALKVDSSSGVLYNFNASYHWFKPGTGYTVVLHKEQTLLVVSPMNDELEFAFYKIEDNASFDSWNYDIFGNETIYGLFPRGFENITFYHNETGGELYKLFLIESIYNYQILDNGVKSVALRFSKIACEEFSISQ